MRELWKGKLALKRLRAPPNDFANSEGTEASIWRVTSLEQGYGCS